MASVLFLASWAVMMGPYTYCNVLPCCRFSRLRANSRVAVRHLLSTERLPFTGTYFSSIALTLYFALGVSSFPKRSFLRCSARRISKSSYNLHMAETWNIYGRKIPRSLKDMVMHAQTC